jgi:5-methylcytosine-specific restriction endonuclease McrA
MNRDGNKCKKCGAVKELCVHHIDHSGSHRVEAFEANNELSNLVVLCNKCHKDIHSLTYKLLAEKYQSDVLEIANEFLSGA